MVQIHTLYADAIKGYAGNWVPQVVMGGGANGSGGNGATDLVNLLTAKVAKDVSVDLTPKK